MRRRQALIVALSLAGLGPGGCTRPQPAAGPASDVRASDAQPTLSPEQTSTLFQPGSRHVLTTGGEAVAEVVPAGTIRLPSGRLMAVDPSWLPAGSWSPQMGPFTATVPPGAYPVDLALVRSEYEVRVAAARLRVADAAVRRWEPALLAGQDPATLPPGNFFGTGVDSGVIALFDAEAVDAVGRGEDRNAATFDVWRADRPVRVPDIAPGADAVAFKSGLGDGYYPTWVGRTAADRIACFVVDMLMLAPRSAAN